MDKSELAYFEKLFRTITLRQENTTKKKRN